MKKKALFLDLDGTFLDKDKHITEGNRKAVEKILALGHKVIINTGRPTDSAIIQAKKLGLDREGCYVSAFNGGVIYDMGKQEQAVRQEELSAKEVHEICAEANRRNVHIQAYTDSHVIVEPRWDDEYVKYYCMRINMKKQVVPDMQQYENPSVKLLVIVEDNREKLEEFKEWVIATYPNLDSFFSNRDFLEVLHKGINKGSALLKTAEILGIDVEDTIAVGDEANDIPMIRKAAVGVAMQNASDEVKACADYITKHDNNNDGVAEVIYKFILEAE